MAKDPAFLFYSSDFLTGTMMMSDEEVGQYVRLLCFQHQHGHFDAVAMQRLCGGNPAALVRAKFNVDENGLFFNERLDIEVVKRKSHSEKQKQNANMRWHKSGNATAMPLENENENVIENRKGNKKRNKKETSENSKQVIRHLNEVYGSKYREDTVPPAKLIDARIEDGYELQELFEIIEYKVAEWSGTPDEKWLTPETLFRPDNCSKYRSQVQNAKARGWSIQQIRGDRKPGGKKIITPAEMIAHLQRKAV